MSLGAQLKPAQAYHDEAARRAELAKRAAAEEETLKRVLSARHFFDYAFQLFEHRLLAGNLPGMISLGGKTFSTAAQVLETSRWEISAHKPREWRTAGKGVWSQGHPLHAVWAEFDKRCKAAGLEPHWSYEYDMGQSSWYDLTVVSGA